MNKTVVGLIVAILLFSVSAGVSWYLQPPPASAPEKKEKDNIAAKTLHGIEVPGPTDGGDARGRRSGPDRRPTRST